jgi:hypothetical protein
LCIDGALTRPDAARDIAGIESLTSFQIEPRMAKAVSADYTDYAEKTETKQRLWSPSNVFFSDLNLCNLRNLRIQIAFVLLFTRCRDR